MMPFAEPDAHTVSELPLERLTTRPVDANGADRRLHRNTASLVERGKACHATRLACGCDTGLRQCVAVLCRVARQGGSAATRSPLPSGTRGDCRFSRTRHADPDKPLTRSRTRLPRTWALCRRPIGIDRECQLAARTSRGAEQPQRMPPGWALLTSYEVLLGRRREVFAKWHSLRVSFGISDPSAAP
jgi:hypothetical protein